MHLDSTDPALTHFRAELELRGLKDKTIEAYLTCCRRLLRQSRCAAEDLSRRRITEFLLDLKRTKRHGPSSLQQHASAIRSFCRYGVDKPEVVAWLPSPKQPKPLPRTVSVAHIEAAIEAADSELARSIIMLSYGAGLRASEVVGLQVRDIQPDKKVIHVRRGKGDKDRLVMLSPRLLEQLRRYWPERQRRRHAGDFGCRCKQEAWLFPGARRGKALSRAWAGQQWRAAQLAAGEKTPVRFHALRHAFATGLLDAGVELRTVQLLLGHARMSTTLRYLRIRSEYIGAVTSPLDHFAPGAKAE